MAGLQVLELVRAYFRGEAGTTDRVWRGIENSVFASTEFLRETQDAGGQAV
jgi:hypothetical protein